MMMMIMMFPCRGDAFICLFDCLAQSQIRFHSSPECLLHATHSAYIWYGRQNDWGLKLTAHTHTHTHTLTHIYGADQYTKTLAVNLTFRTRYQVEYSEVFREANGLPMGYQFPVTLLYKTLGLQEISCCNVLHQNFTSIRCYSRINLAEIQL